ncbi:MAG: hypothetical protein AAF235_04780, partial [Planctomycetota bacterium]
PRHMKVVLFGALACFIAAVVVFANRGGLDSPRNTAGMIAFAAAIASVWALLVSTLRPRALAAWLLGTARAGFFTSALAGFAALAIWARAVEVRTAEQITTSAARTEASDNIQFFVLSAPLRSIEVLGYGAGLGSAACIAFLIWLGRDRPRLPKHTVFALAWVGLSMIAFSSLGRGTHRYLLPMLPGVCILGGAWFASWCRDVAPRFGPRIAAALVAGLTIFYGYWYGIGRETYHTSRSPRDFIAAVLSLPGVDATRLGSLDTWDPALTVYAGAPVEPWANIERSIDYPHGAPPIRDLRARLAESGDTYTLLIRARENPNYPGAPAAIDRLAGLGFEITEPPAEHLPTYVIDRRTTPMTAVIIRAVPSFSD